MECHKIKKVEYLEGYKLKLKFNDKKTKIIDLESRLKKAKNMLLPLKDIEFFKQVKTDGITIVWPNGVDFCPDHLYIPLPVQSWTFERVKTSGLNDRKGVHMTNMNPFPIV